MNCMSDCASSLFQSTRSHGARPSTARHSGATWCFNPRAHTERDNIFVAMMLKSGSFQSTRSHGARLKKTLDNHAVTSVSIHALTRSATACCTFTCADDWFQSTRSHGARLPNYDYVNDKPLFQSTRSHGARRYNHHNVVCIKSFNPRAHTERDYLRFESKTRCPRFNPRAHTERDGDVFSGVFGSVDVSIHALTRSATCSYQYFFRMCQCFNPRAHTERDYRHCKSTTNGRCFNPRAHTERDFCVLAFWNR